jgi:hypothetical protein
LITYKAQFGNWRHGPQRWCRWILPATSPGGTFPVGVVPPGDTISGMAWGEVELEPEVAGWLEGLDDQRWGQAPGRRIIMLTVFTKTRMREAGEIARAQAAMARCQRETHTADEYEEG